MQGWGLTHASFLRSLRPNKLIAARVSVTPGCLGWVSPLSLG